jgi:hypothetical protein
MAIEKESTLNSFLKKYRKLDTFQIQNLIDDLKHEFEVAGGPSSESFIILNDSSNNLKLMALQLLLEEKATIVE